MINPPRRSCVFFGNAQSVFVSRTRDKLIEYGIEVDIVDIAKKLCGTGEKAPPAPLRIIKRVADVWNAVRRCPRHNYAVIHTLTPHIVWLAPLLSIYFQRVVLVCYGSDVLRRARQLDLALKFGLLFVNEVAATNDNVLQAVIDGFSAVRHKNPSIVRFGLPVLEEISNIEIDQVRAKRAIGLDVDRYCVALGYAATVGQRQDQLIMLVKQFPKELSHVQFVVPCQYGDADQIARVKRVAISEETGMTTDRFVVLEEFFDLKKAALMRLAIDVLVNNSVSDSFSGTVLETMYAGNLVLAASHLPYSSMPGSDSALIQYNELSEIVPALSLPNLQKRKSEAFAQLHNTRRGIEAAASWKNVIRDWERLIFSDHNAAG